MLRHGKTATIFLLAEQALSYLTVIGSQEEQQSFLDGFNFGISGKFPDFPLKLSSLSHL